MAKHMANVMAKTGGIGIAKSLMRDHYMKNEKAWP